VQPQWGMACVDWGVTDGLDPVGSFSAGEAAIADFMSGIQRMNGVRSVMSTMYQFLRTESHRAPSALTLSFSAKGVTKLILIGNYLYWASYGRLFKL
jgi:hypothetical protein